MNYKRKTYWTSSLKDTFEKIKRQATDWEKIIIKRKNGMEYKRQQTREAMIKCFCF